MTPRGRHTTLLKTKSYGPIEAGSRWLICQFMFQPNGHRLCELLLGHIQVESLSATEGSYTV